MAWIRDGTRHPASARTSPRRHFSGAARQKDGHLLDDIDHRLLALLREDASRPLKTLAAAVSLSRSSVRDRIARMQANGVIRRYTIETAPATPQVCAILQLRLRRTPDPVVVQAVTAMTEVVRCYSLAGEVDLLVELAAADADALNRSRDRIAQLPGVASVLTALVLKRDKAPEA